MCVCVYVETRTVHVRFVVQVSTIGEIEYTRVTRLSKECQKTGIGKLREKRETSLVEYLGRKTLSAPEFRPSPRRSFTIFSILLAFFTSFRASFTFFIFLVLLWLTFFFGPWYLDCIRQFLQTMVQVCSGSGLPIS